MNAQRKILIITGSAPCTWDDIAAAIALLVPESELWPPVDFMIIGLDAVDKYSFNAKYFATYHPSDIEPALERRKQYGGNINFKKIIAHQQHHNNATGRDLVDLIIPCESPTGSSALLGVLAGIKMGYEKIIVCGCPLIGVNDKNYDYANFQKGWTAKFSEIKDVTRSMSGWTRDLLGAPTAEWLNINSVIPAKAGIQE